MNFADLGLSPEVLKAVDEAGYTVPTPIQEKAIPLVLMGRDLLGCAQTGTGKTASFTLPMIDILASGRARARMPRSLILEPTRELAAQVAESFEVYGKYHALSKALLIGGSSITEQERKLERGVDVLIATPGRLLDLFERGRILLAGVKILVIDESDRMLDMGFIPDVERIVGLLPKIRQTMFFSATMPPEIRRLADTFLINPKEVAVDPPSSAADTVVQSLVKIAGERKDKRAALRALVRAEAVKSALVFCNRKRDVDILFRSLKKHEFSVAALHGDMAQPVRMDTLARFKNGEFQLLVCSDVAARGLDLPEVSHVFNFDVPIHAEDYVHRIGRTGRAGRSGRSIMLALPEEARALAGVVGLLGHPIPEMTADGVAGWTGAEPPPRDGRRRRTRKRSSDQPRGTPRARNVAPETAPSQPAEPQPAEPQPAEPRPAGTQAPESRNSADRRPAKTAPRRAEPDRAEPDRAEPAKAAPKERTPRERTPKERTPKERPVAAPPRPSEPFGEHTPAFMLRPVDIA